MTVVAEKRRHWSDVVVPSAGLLGAMVIARGEVWWVRVLAALAVILVVAVLLWFIRGWRTHAIVLTADALELRRRWGTRVLHRKDITAVRGNHATRPRWSTRAFVELEDERVELPVFLDVKPGDLIDQIRDWHEASLDVEAGTA